MKRMFPAALAVVASLLVVPYVVVPTSAYDLTPTPTSDSLFQGSRGAVILNGNSGAGWGIGVTEDGTPVPYPAPFVVLSAKFYNQDDERRSVRLDLRDPNVTWHRDEMGAVHLEVGDCYWNPDGSKAPYYAVFQDGDATVAFCDDRG